MFPRLGGERNFPNGAADWKERKDRGRQTETGICHERFKKGEKGRYKGRETSCYFSSSDATEDGEERQLGGGGGGRTCQRNDRDTERKFQPNMLLFGICWNMNVSLAIERVQVIKLGKKGASAKL